MLSQRIARRFYRLVSSIDPPPEDFQPLAATGRRFRDPDLQRRAEEVSVWDTFERAVKVRERKPELRFVAVLDVPPEVVLTPGRGGHWGIPRGCPAEEIMGWVIRVAAIP